MNVKHLISNLKNPHPGIRLDVIRVLGMVRETLALDALRQRYNEETESEIKEAIVWAGQRIHAALQEGYSTRRYILKTFGVEHEVEQIEIDPEAELLRELDAKLQVELLSRQTKAQQKKSNLAAGAMLASAALGAAGVPVPGPSVGGTFQAGAEVASSNLGDSRPQLGKSRLPAVRPTTDDIALWLKRLAESADSRVRLDAIRQLRDINNLAALPHLARIFIQDSDEEVRRLAEQAGLHLYANAVYWEMEQDGTLAKETQELMQILGKTGPLAQTGQLQTQTPTPEQPPAKPQEDIATILRRAEEARERRRKMRGS